MDPLWYLEVAREEGFRAGCLAPHPPHIPLILPEVQPVVGFQVLNERQREERARAQAVHALVQRSQKRRMRKAFQALREHEEEKRCPRWRKIVLVGAAVVTLYIFKRR